MATRTAKTTGNASNSKNWTPEAVPKAGDNLIVPSGINITMNIPTTRLNSMEVQSGGTLSGTEAMLLGGAAAGNNGVHENILLWIASGATFAFSGNIGILNNFATPAQTLSTGGHTITGRVLIESGIGKIQLLEDFTCTHSEGFELSSSSTTLELNAKKLTCHHFTGSAGTLDGKEGTIKTTGVPGSDIALKLPSTVTNNTTLTLEVEGTESSELERLIELNGCGELKAIAAIGPVATRIQPQTASNEGHIAVVNELKINNKGAAAKKGLHIAQGNTLNVTGSVSGDGTAEKPNRLETDVSGKKSKLKLKETIEQALWIDVRDIEVTGGEWYLPNGLDSANETKTNESNVNILFRSIHQTFERSLAIAQAQAISLPKQANLAKSLTQAQTSKVVKGITKLPLEFTQSQVVASLKQVGSRLSNLLVEASPQRGVILVSRSISASQAQVAGLEKRISHSIANVQSVLSKLQVASRSSLSFTQAQVSTITKKDLGLHREVIQNVSPGVLKAISLRAKNVLQEVLPFVKQPQQVQLIAIALTQSVNVEFKKFTQKVVRVVVPIVPKVQMFLPKSISIVQEVIAKPIKQVHPPTISLTQPQSVSMSSRYLELFHVAVGVVQNVTSSLETQVNKRLGVNQEVEIGVHRGFNVLLSNVVETAVELTKTFMRHVLIRQEIVFEEDEGEAIRHASAGVITWTRDTRGRLIKVESNLGQFEGEIEPGETDVVYFTLNRKPEEVEGKDGTTRDPQWQ
jgi:hypothetical protein